MGRRLVHTLSGGEQQKLALAGVLAMRVKVLIMDEALAMLDKPVRRSVRSLMASLRVDPGLTIMEMTGSIESVSSADRVIFLAKGSIEFDGAPYEFFSSRLGIHWSSMNGGLQALHSALHDRGLITAERAEMPGTVPDFINYINKIKNHAR
jgi:energy-coupling factor transporter ATP-binding protein EcfA2